MPPFPGMPYGNAPAWCFPLIELSIYTCMALCIAHARKRGGAALSYLFGGLIFGLLLEYFEVSTGSYTYGRFWVMFGNEPAAVPLWVGCGWAIIMYTARLFSDAVRLPLVAAAALDTLLALNIDLSTDVPAYRLHMWHWDWNGSGLNPLTAQWFGIPYGNFIGWITVVFCYSAFSRAFERFAARRNRTGFPWFGLVPLLAVACSLASLIGSEMFLFPFLVKYLRLTTEPRLIFAVAGLLALTIQGWRKRQPSQWALDPVAQWVPCWFHLFFAFCFFALGFYRENPWMTAAAGINLLIGIALHASPHWQSARLRADARLTAPGTLVNEG